MVRGLLRATFAVLRRCRFGNVGGFCPLRNAAVGCCKICFRYLFLRLLFIDFVFQIFRYFHLAQIAAAQVKPAADFFGPRFHLAQIAAAQVKPAADFLR